MTSFESFKLCAEDLAATASEMTSVRDPVDVPSACECSRVFLPSSQRSADRCHSFFWRACPHATSIFLWLQTSLSGFSTKVTNYSDTCDACPPADCASNLPRRHKANYLQPASAAQPCMTMTVCSQCSMQYCVVEPMMKRIMAPLLCAAITTTAAARSLARLQIASPMLSRSVPPRTISTLHSACSKCRMLS